MTTPIAKQEAVEQAIADKKAMLSIQERHGKVQVARMLRLELEALTAKHIHIVQEIQEWQARLPGNDFREWRRRQLERFNRKLAKKIKAHGGIEHGGMEWVKEWLKQRRIQQWEAERAKQERDRELLQDYVCPVYFGPDAPSKEKQRQALLNHLRKKRAALVAPKGGKARGKMKQAEGAESCEAVRTCLEQGITNKPEIAKRVGISRRQVERIKLKLTK
ncbi:MAG: hypothetical protein ACRESI_01225 [Gammaproteobacteria bacterium]